LKFRRIAMEFFRTKSGGRCSFHFTSSESSTLCRIFLRKPSIMELLVASNVGLSCWNFQKDDLFGGNLRNWNDIFSNEKWRALLASFH
jgi:hypothetical protein